MKKGQPVPCTSWAAVCEEKAQLKVELKQCDRRMHHLHQVFMAKMAEFHKLFLVILGIKLCII